MIRVTLAGPDLEGLAVEQPAASVRLLLPSAGRRARDAEMERQRVPPARRATTDDPDFHAAPHRPRGPRARSRDRDPRWWRASEWADAAGPGDPAAISGPGRGYAIDPETPAFLLAGDETAIPAIGQLLEALPADGPVQVHVEVAHPDARLALPGHPGATVEWCDLPPGASPATRSSPPSAARTSPGHPGVGGGEAAAVQRIRRHLFEDRGPPAPRPRAGLLEARPQWRHRRRRLNVPEPRTLRSDNVGPEHPSSALTVRLPTFSRAPNGSGSPTAPPSARRPDHLDGLKTQRDPRPRRGGHRRPASPTRRGGHPRPPRRCSPFTPRPRRSYRITSGDVRPGRC